jgi:hypothetical protein
MPDGEDVRRLDVTVDQARGMGLAQRQADLSQQVHRPSGGQRAVLLDQFRQAQARQVLQDVVVTSVLSAPVIEDLYRVGVRERGSRVLDAERKDDVCRGRTSFPFELKSAAAPRAA